MLIENPYAIFTTSGIDATTENNPPSEFLRPPAENNPLKKVQKQQMHETRHNRYSILSVIKNALCTHLSDF
jgi:hypothetical protein